MPPSGNGPKTEQLEARFNAAALQLENRITDLESQMRVIRGVGALFGSVMVGVLTVLVIHVLL